MCRIGRLTVTAEEDYIVSIQHNANGESLTAGTSSEVLEHAEAQLLSYLDGKRRTFDLPLRLQGTPFQISVWRVLQDIPYGTTLTYGEVAHHVGCPKAARAVGMACHRNPLMIVVPCHRVVGANGRLTGYACGLDIKRQLLENEQI